MEGECGAKHGGRGRRRGFGLLCWRVLVCAELVFVCVGKRWEGKRCGRRKAKQRSGARSVAIVFANSYLSVSRLIQARVCLGFGHIRMASVYLCATASTSYKRRRRKEEGDVFPCSLGWSSLSLSAAAAAPWILLALATWALFAFFDPTTNTPTESPAMRKLLEHTTNANTIKFS